MNIIQFFTFQLFIIPFVTFKVNEGNRSEIQILGAREHNLKNIDIELPRNSLIVFTGLSGSGKSSLAFDTIFAEGQRRYIETFLLMHGNLLGDWKDLMLIK